MPKVFHFFYGSVIFHCVCVRVCGLVTKLLSTLATPWTVARQTPLPLGFSRHGLPFPSPGDLSDQGIKPEPPALQKDSLPIETPSVCVYVCMYVCICVCVAHIWHIHMTNLLNPSICPCTFGLLPCLTIVNSAKTRFP